MGAIMSATQRQLEHYSEIAALLLFPRIVEALEAIAHSELPLEACQEKAREALALVPDHMKGKTT